MYLGAAGTYLDGLRCDGNGEGVGGGGWFVSVRMGSAWFSLAGLGWAKLRSAKLGWDQLSCAQLDLS